jgi:chitinase
VAETSFLLLPGKCAQSLLKLRLSYLFLQDDTIDVLPLAFLDVAFDTGELPSIDFANVRYIIHTPCSTNTNYPQICNAETNSVFPGTSLPDCSFLASDIQECQAKGKIVTLSIGGADSVVGFVSNSQAKQFADTIWDLFLGGQSKTRPFGSAILDG